MLFITEIEAIDPLTGEKILKAGPVIRARNFIEAERIALQINCKVLGRLVEVIPYEDITEINLN